MAVVPAFADPVQNIMGVVDGPAVIAGTGLVGEPEGAATFSFAIENDQAGSRKRARFVDEQAELVQVTFERSRAGKIRQSEYRCAGMSIGRVPQYATRDAAIIEIHVVVRCEIVFPAGQRQPIRDRQRKGRTVGEPSRLEGPKGFFGAECQSRG